MSCVKKIDKNTTSALSSSLNVFNLPPTNVAFARSGYRELLPLNPVTDQPYTFRVFSDNLWVDLSKIYLQLEFSCESKKDGEDWSKLEAENTKIAPIENIGKTFIRQLKVQIGNDEVYDSGTLYAYRAHIIDSLSLPSACKESSAWAGFFSNTKSWDDVADEGFKRRAESVANGKRVQTVSRLDFDLANQPLLLLNNTNIMFTIYRNSDDFLMEYRDSTPAFCRLVVTGLKLMVRVVEVQASLNLEIYRLLETRPVQYAVRKTEIRSSFLPAGGTDYDQTLFSSVVPRRLILGLVSGVAFSGSQSYSPLSFRPHDLKELSVTAGGDVYPSVPYRMDFNKKHCIRPYLDMFDALGQSMSANTPGITLKAFLDGWTFFVIPLTSTLDDCGGLELVRSGTTTVHLRFGAAVPAFGLELVVLAEFDQVISIDRDRRVFTDMAI